ncbi:CocE/NonD family hydrolase [bacterium]|nr:CocE/NonD family hydrolase [bacterium]
MRPVSLLLLVILCSPLWGDPAPRKVMVPMIDGVGLATDIYLPAEQGKFPAVLMITPYGRAGAKALAGKLLEKGFAVVSQDMRGRGDSEGSNVVIFQSNAWGKPHDGKTTLKWLDEQPWFNGRVATWGGSAVGITQNLLAPGASDSLHAQFVEVGSSNLYAQCFYQGGAFRKSMIEGWLKATGMEKGNLDVFRSHPTYDDFWDGMNPEKYAERTVAPGIFIGGWYDIFCQGTINSFQEIQTRGGPRAKGNCRLIMGPWAHGPFDELKYPKNASERPPAADFFRFIDHHLKDASNGVDKDWPVHYYVMGDPGDADSLGNVWRHADSWPPACKATSFYFHADHSLQTSPPSTEASLSYRYDPAQPVPTIGGQNLILPKGPMDQRRIENRDDVLLFTGAELSEPLEITGRIKATLYVISDSPDTDFTVKLCDVYPDGRSMLITDGILRARYRESFTTPTMMQPGQVYTLEVDLWSTSIILSKGHRLRVAVSSSNAPRFDPNPNTGKMSWEESERRIANNTIRLSPGQASCIVLPILPTSSKTTAKRGS